VELRFENLYEDHFDFIWRSARYLGVPDAQLDDAVQDVFIVAHRRLTDFEGRSSARTWLFSIAVRVASDYRRSGRRRARLTGALQQVSKPAPETPFEGTANIEARALLQQFLAKLPPEQRVAFSLAEIEQMSVPEIALATGDNANTIYSRLRSARQAFAQAVQLIEAANRGAKS
jgi:RNA polymerase sigma-70 factor, ECF subfamily